jgi:hypothetical protein
MKGRKVKELSKWERKSSLVFNAISVGSIEPQRLQVIHLLRKAEHIPRSEGVTGSVLC